MITIKFDSRLLLFPLAADIPVEVAGHYAIIQASAGRSINQTLQDLDIRLSQAVSAVVNGHTTDLEQPLVPGDEVRLLPQIAGGK
jgi:molybdopterin converting factor small subunit